MDVQQYIIDDFLKPYLPSAKYLKSAKENFPSFEGSFSIKRAVYTKKGVDSGHLNMIDLLMCYNQLVYVGFASTLKYNRIKDLNFSYEYFRKNQLNCLMLELNKVKFRAIIAPSDFLGSISVNKIKLIKNTYFIQTEYDFENKASGEILLGMKI
ncbi:MAG: FcoT family thioesterase [Candidatus Nanoarchaeia archaeon]